MEAVKFPFALLNSGSLMLDLGDQVLELSRRSYCFQYVQLHLCAGQGHLGASSYQV